MKYYSTNDKFHSVSLQQAVLRCFAPDGGVYMPDRIPLFPSAIFRNIPQMSLKEIGYIVASSMFGGDIDAETINDIVRETLPFDIPLVELDAGLYALELFHGPTGTFKDIGARFMARIVDHFIKTSGRPSTKVNVFVATSGDTGSAVADAFAGHPSIDLFLLYPKGTTLRLPADTSNIHPIAIRGTFDECQHLAKEIYGDPQLNRRMTITSANTVNIARLLPQMFFYFHAYARLLQHTETPGPITISVPCGNLGNLTAALFAGQMGLPVKQILASGYGNERLWGNISHDGRLDVSEVNSRNLSNNLARINCLLTGNPSMAEMIRCHTFGDAEVSEEESLILDRYGYRLNRNSAMACRAARMQMRPDTSSIFLATTDPGRRPDTPSPAHARPRRSDHPSHLFPPQLSVVRDHILSISSSRQS